MDVPKEHLGARIKQFRKLAGLKQAQLAEACGLEVNTISRYETGASAPSIEQLIRLSEALKISPIAILSPMSEPDAGAGTDAFSYTKDLSCSPSSLSLGNEQSSSVATIYKQYIGEKIKSLRIEKGFSQSMLAHAAGLGPTTISRYETATNAPDIEHLLSIATALGVSPIALLPPNRIEQVKKDYLIAEIHKEIATDLPISRLQDILKFIRS